MPDGQGGYTETLAIVSVRPGRARPLSVREVAAGGFQLGSTVMRFYSDASFDAREGDVIQMDSNQKTYRVIGGARNPSQMGHHLEVDAVETT